MSETALWIFLLGLHLIGLVGYTLLLRKSALSKIDKKFLAALLQTAIFLPVLFVIPFFGISLSFPLWQWAILILSAVFQAGLTFLNIKALEHLEASVFSIIFNLRLFFTTILGIVFLNELPSNLQLAGGFIIFLSILFLNLHKNNKYKTFPVWIGLFVTIWYSFHAIIEKYNVLNAGLIEYIFVVQGIATLILWFFAKNSNISFSLFKKSFDKHTVKLLVLRSLAGWGYIFALKYGSVAATNYISGLSVALIVVFGVFFLKEKNHLREKICALVIALLGATFIFLGS